MSHRTYWLIATAILVMGAGLRLWDLAQYPPGPHYDEAANVLITRSIAFGGADLFPIVNSYQGREALYYYLAAPFFQWVHDGRFSLQVVNVLTNLITLAATIALGRAFFGRARGAIIGLLAGALLALSFPQILLARQAFRAPTLPFMQALALLALWRGLISGRLLWLVAGGLLAGGALYTYMAARLFPVWLLIGGLALLLLDRRGTRVRQGVVFMGALALAAAPMLIFALNNPDIFLGRLYEVTQPEQSISLAASLSRHLRMFFIEGEALLRYNLPGRPYFTWPEGLLLLVGLGVSVWRLRHRGPALKRAAYGLLLLAPLMIAPSVISVGGFPPNHMRSIAMVPLIFILIAVGFEAVGSWVMARWPQIQRLSLPLALVGLLVGALLVGHLYLTWAARTDLYADTDADLAAAAAWLKTNAGPEDRIYVAARDRDHPTVSIANLPNVTWLGTETLFRPPPGQSGIVVYPRSAPPPALWSDWLEGNRIPDMPLGPDGQPAFMAFRLTGNLPLPVIQSPPDDVQNGFLTLLGYQANPVFPAAVGAVALYWRVDQTPQPTDLTPLVQVEDYLGNVLARAELPLSQTDAWPSGTVLFARLNVRLPPATAPSPYALRVTWVARQSDQYLSFTTADGAPAGVWAQAGQLEVLRPVNFPDPVDLPIGTRQDVDFAPGVRLLGWNWPPATHRPGEDVRLTLWWQGTPAAERANIELLAHLRGPEATEVPLWSGPLHYPPPQWVDDEVVSEAVRWPLPRDMDSGAYTLILRVDEVAVALGTFEVAGVPRQFAPPPAAEITNQDLGEAFALYGYTLERDADTLRLELVWQARTAVPVDYTVFVHLVDAEGNILAQDDVMPQSNGYPTSLWAAGEYVVDAHTFAEVLPGVVAARVGLYDQNTGQRLRLADGRDFVVLPVPNS
jgi:hypothetical protein